MNRILSGPETRVKEKNRVHPQRLGDQGHPDFFKRIVKTPLVVTHKLF